MGGHSDVIISLSGTSLYIITTTAGDGGGAEHSCCVFSVKKHLQLFRIDIRAIIQMDDLLLSFPFRPNCLPPLSPSLPSPFSPSLFLSSFAFRQSDFLYCFPFFFFPRFSLCSCLFVFRFVYHAFVRACAFFFVYHSQACRS